MLDTVTSSHVIAYLNSLLLYDAQAVERLVEFRTPCNSTLRDHPTVQVLEEDGISKVGLFGVLNGIFGVNEGGFGAIAAIVEEDGTITKFIATKTKVTQ